MSSNALAGPEYGIAIIIYLVIMLLVGAYFGKKSKEDKDGFLLAGRELPVIVLVGTLLATWFGGGTVVGGANFIYKTGPWAGVFYFILFRQLHQFLHAVRLERRQAEGTFGNGISGRDGFFPTRGLAR